MRALIRFPIIHGSEDMGGLDASVNRARTDEEIIKQKAVVTYFWRTIESAIDGFSLDLYKVKIYQDSLPVCGKEVEIVDDTAKTGSPNYLLLQRLRNKGATVIGTESPELLLEEYSLMKRVYQADSGQTLPSQALAQSLLDRRDEFIVQRINDTLFDGDMGILFLGMNHRIEGRLPDDIKLIQPLGDLKPK